MGGNVKQSRAESRSDFRCSAEAALTPADDLCGKGIRSRHAASWPLNVCDVETANRLVAVAISPGGETTVFLANLLSI